METYDLRISKDLKINAESVCNSLGISLNDAFNLFINKLIEEKKIPFEVDPFYSPKNMKRLQKSISQLEKNKGSIHNLEEYL